MDKKSLDTAFWHFDALRKEQFHQVRRDLAGPMPELEAFKFIVSRLLERQFAELTEASKGAGE